MIASTSLTQLRYIKEAVYGVIPVVGNPKELRMTGESLAFALDKTMSNEINADRATSDMIPTKASTSGSIETELSFAEYDEMIEAALMGTWGPFGTGGLSAAFSATTTATTITASVPTAGPNAFTNLVAGQWFKLVGTNTANDTRVFRVSQSVAPTSTVITLDTNTPAIPGGPFAASVTQAARLANGNILRTFTFEKNFTDVDEFFAYRGQAVNNLSIKMSTGSITTMSIGLMGRDAVADADTMLPGVPVVSTANPVMSGVSGQSCALWANGAPLVGTFINSITLNLDNSLRSVEALCSLGSVGIGIGTIKCTASVEMYFTSGRQFFDQFLTNTNQEISFTATDTTGRGYMFTMPKANTSKYEVKAGGKDADLMVSLEFTGLLDKGALVPAKRKVLFVDRVGSALV